MKIPPCYMEHKNATLNNPRIQGIRLYAPHIQTIKLPGTIKQFYTLASELNPQENERYQPGHGDTQCDAATGDFADKCGCFLPAGFFWNDLYINLHDQYNLKWEFKYKVNVHELSANNLYDWLIGKYSAGFGWERINTVTELQELANKGYLCIISGKNNLPKGHGHISIVLPENKEKGMIAQRIKGQVFCPIIFQAGAICYNWTNKNSWFLSKQFKDTHGFFFNRGINE